MERKALLDKESEAGHLYADMQRFRDEYEAKQNQLIQHLAAKDAENRDEIARLRQKLRAHTDSENSLATDPEVITMQEREFLSEEDPFLVSLKVKSNQL